MGVVFKQFSVSSFESLRECLETDGKLSEADGLVLVDNLRGLQCPLLCKDFIIDAWQIYYARSKGADAILLIASVLPDLDIKYMSKICKKLGLASLLEVHNEREMDRVIEIDGIELIGINNCDLGTCWDLWVIALK
ncbi:Indole-3-glycerol-phosphate synthase [Heracleum sosnowskyi]|uniref:indole-3-glycerol-phosphate synthase n=1 Tax=Heracleum sosnowskyi TaxID=360622 RepID=A0AAD8HF44_9APIA|nr:Indole-3-glycerol-phosphate synthase [Heracleum sosnowskyi]